MLGAVMTARGVHNRRWWRCALLTALLGALLAVLVAA